MVSGSFNYLPPEDTGLDLLYQDQGLIVVNKPAGLLTVPGRDQDKQDCLISRVQREFASARIVHRLDMATSGAIVIALNDEIHRQLSMLFEQRKVAKRYVAIVNGLLEGEGVINLPLITDWPNRPKQIIDHERGKPARTRFSAKHYDHTTHSSRVELIPETGRTHQIRVHLLSLGHAILGDRLYASDEVRDQSPRLLLHSTLLSFSHPASNKPITIHSAEPF
ncbi:MAG: pseudouridine synthase [Thioalkalispiraceae bacterium]|jgi:tRNA pseudouridine32 synthase/23S rRNA pseudouridine746 synthase